MRPLEGITRATKVLTIVALVAQAIGYVINTVRGAGQFNGQESLGETLAFGAMGMLVALVAIAQVVVGVVWCFKAQQQACARGATWEAGWAAGGWFIPVANLVIPFLVLRDMAQALLAQVPRYFVPWWVLWIVDTVLRAGASIYGLTQGFRLTRVMLDAEGEAAMALAREIANVAASVGAISLVVYIAAGLLWLRFLRDIDGAVDAPAPDASAVM